MSVIPRYLFNNDCSLLLPGKKSEIVRLIEELPSITEMQQANNESDTILAVNELNDVKSCIVADEVMDIDDAEVSWMDAMDCLDVKVKVAIIDAMAIVQGIKKTLTMKKMSDFRLLFCKKIQRRAKNYSETRVVFDEYPDQSLKKKPELNEAKVKGRLLIKHLGVSTIMILISFGF